MGAILLIRRLVGKSAEGHEGTAREGRTRQAMAVQPVGPDDEQPHAESREGDGLLAGWRRAENVEKVKQQEESNK